VSLGPQATITHTFLNADGSVAAGTVTFKLTDRISNGVDDVEPTVITAALNGSGAISVQLYSNQDAGTVPPDTYWQAFIRVSSLPPENFRITVPTGGGSIDLYQLLPGAQQVY
jgi:hypothetical protein